MLDCQAAYRDIYQTHKPMSTSEEPRHELRGSNCFSVLDIRNCFHQFEIGPAARKFYRFLTPWGIYSYEGMIMGTFPASSEIQRRVRDTIKDCQNAIITKADILVHGKGKDHDTYLREDLTALPEKDLTLRKEKYAFGKPHVKWFGNIYTKDGMSLDPVKCKIIKEWPQPKSCNEVKSFLQTECTIQCKISWWKS